VVSPSAPPANSVPAVTPPPPKATPAPSPPTKAVVAPPAAKPATPAPQPQASWLLTILAGVIAGSVGTIYLGVRWRLAKRKRLEEMDEALLRMWALDKDTTKAKPRSRA
jgi:hypothetical protein